MKWNCEKWNRTNEHVDVQDPLMIVPKWSEHYICLVNIVTIPRKISGIRPSCFTVRLFRRKEDPEEVDLISALPPLDSSVWRNTLDIAIQPVFGSNTIGFPSFPHSVTTPRITTLTTFTPLMRLQALWTLSPDASNPLQRIRRKNVVNENDSPKIRSLILWERAEGILKIVCRLENSCLSLENFLL